MKLISDKKFQIYYILVAIILLVVLGIFYYNNLKVMSTSDSAVHAQEVLRKNDNVLLDILDIETGVRGYIISENNLYLESYNKAVKAMNSNLSQLSALTQSNSQQSTQVDSLKVMTAKKLFLLQKIIDDRKVDLLEPNEKIAILKDGKIITDSIKNIIYKIKVDEYNALKLKKSENENSVQYSEILFFLLLILVFVIFTLVFIIVKNLKIRNDELELFTSSQKLLSNYSLSLIEASLDPLITINIDGKISGMNEATVIITGVEREKLIGSDFFEYFTEPQMAREVYKEVFANGSVADSPLTIRHKEGKLTDVLFNGSVYKDQQGKVLGIVIVARDVTAQNLLSNYSLSLIEASLDPLVTISIEGKITDMNEATVKITGLEREKLIGSDFFDYFTEPQMAREVYQEVFANESVADSPLTIRHKDGKLTDVLFNGSVYKDPQGNVLGIVIVARDVTAQKLLSNYSLSLIEASLDPLVTISIEGKITDMNEATVKITGLEREQLIGSDFFDYFTEPQMAREVYKEVFANGSVADSPLTLRHKEGKLTDVLFSGSVYKDDQGNVLGIVIVARDTTEQKRIETELIEAKVFAELATGIAEEEKRNAENAASIAENAVKAKQQFLSNMSHEIRTPMNAIIGFTKVVLKTDLTAKQKEYLNAIKMSGDALIVLINDILDLAKVDAGKMSFEKTPFKMKSSIASMLHLFETKIQEKNLQLVKEYDSNIPAVIIGDPIRLHQIILNLVSNAVKFTSEGKITVNVRLIDQDEENVTIEFAVADTGIGIPEEKLTTIFENFQQASSGTSRIYGGTGLGLAIVKQLVEPQGGSIKVKSTVGEGSTFSFRLKFQKTTADAELETEMLEVDKETKSIKVLVVEDIALNQLLMKTLLDDFGFERDIAENGKIAIDKLLNNSYDVILMDLQMPEMNGFEATEYIRKTMNSDIPIIALTADVTTVDLAKCKAVGMNDYIAKPVDERLLYSKIVNIVRKHTSKKEKEMKKNIVPKTQKYIDLGYLDSRTKSNPKLMMEMIAAYLQQTPPLVTAMTESLLNKDWALLRASAHKMVPSFSIMGISPEYEEMAKKIQGYSGDLENQKEEIDDLVLQLTAVCNQACEELEIEFNNIKNRN
ncbi:PAS domain S-box protein [Flavobacterium sp. XN-5]|uniref:PAS domain S-box protein n=1 Tax=Flavobacterium sp. XN-5 TaxID=2599390 RepID=UPI0011CBB571|nr:PAS domain S-box protein [Flavobacterium sp. XN-5]NGY38815.1 PAS domain S-box protein [Flavobacterium sp. XN-5]